MKDTSKTIQAVAFDMDGLMFDTEDVYWKAGDALLARRGLRYTAELCNDIMGRPPEYCFKRMIEYHQLSDDWQSLRSESEEIFLELLNDGYQAMPGLFALLDLLEKRSIPKAICTSSARRILDAVLKRDQLFERFDFVITSEDVTEGKPAPEIYLTAADSFGQPTSQMLVLEDSVAGAMAAHRAGAVSVVIKAHHNSHLQFPHANAVLNSLDDTLLLNLPHFEP